jgi:hypothetical protein
METIREAIKLYFEPVIWLRKKFRAWMNGGSV